MLNCYADFEGSPHECAPAYRGNPIIQQIRRDTPISSDKMSCCTHLRRVAFVEKGGNQQSIPIWAETPSFFLTQTGKNGKIGRGVRPEMELIADDLSACLSNPYASTPELSRASLTPAVSPPSAKYFDNQLPESVVNLHSHHCKRGLLLWKMATTCVNPVLLSKLFSAAFGGDLDTVKQLLAKHQISPDATDPNTVCQTLVG